MAVTVTAPSLFSALYLLDVIGERELRSAYSSLLVESVGGTDRPMQPARAGALRAKQKPATISASTEPRTYETIGKAPTCREARKFIGLPCDSRENGEWASLRKRNCQCQGRDGHDQAHHAGRRINWLGLLNAKPKCLATRVPITA
jgi:hypothetical protein